MKEQFIGCTNCKHYIDEGCSLVVTKNTRVCFRDRLPQLPDLHEPIVEDTLLHDELVALYEDVIKDYKRLYVEGETEPHWKTTDSYHWEIHIRIDEGNRDNNKPSAFDEEITSDKYERLPVRKQTAMTKLRKLKKLLKTEYKQLKEEK